VLLAPVAVAQLDPIHEAARQGDVEAVRRLLEARPELLHARDLNGWTPLHWAADRGRAELTALLLERGADPDHVAGNRTRPLHLVKDAESARLLIGAGADVHAPSRSGTPIHRAAVRGRPDVVLALLEARAFLDMEELILLRLEDRAITAIDEIEPVLDDLGKYLYPAAEHGLPRLVARMLDEGVDPDLPNRRYYEGTRTALSAAIGAGHFDVARLLVERGASVHVNAAYSHAKIETTLLHATVETRNAPMVRFLLEHGADAGVRCPSYDVVPLHLAASLGDFECSRLLLEHGADPNARGGRSRRRGDAPDSGFTPLMVAAGAGNHDFARYLLKEGACLDACTAAALGMRDELAALLDGDATLLFAQAPPRGETLLHLAARFGHVETARLLVERGLALDLGAPSPRWELHGGILDPLIRLRLSSDFDFAKDGDTALHRAAEAGRTEVVRFFLARGADVEGFGRATTPLRDATTGGHHDVVALLLEHGADPNASESTLVHGTIRDNDVRMARLLLAHGAAVDVPDEYGGTPLDRAVYLGHRELCTLFHDAGAELDLYAACVIGDLDVVNSALEEDPARAGRKQEARHGLTPMILAAREGHVEVMERLVQAGASILDATENGLTPLRASVSGGRIEAVAWLLARGSLADRRSETSSTPLSTAAVHDQALAAALLLRGGADIGVRDDFGNALLHEAARHDACSVIEVLLEAGADIEARNDQGWTPLHVAAQKGKLEAAALLLERGADVNARGHRRETPLFVAELRRYDLERGEEGDRPGVARLLREAGGVR